MNDQEKFWKVEYAEEYFKNNSHFNLGNGIKGWAKMLDRCTQIRSILECGSNIGRNINFLNYLLPDAKKSIIEISLLPFEFVKKNYELENAFNGSILDANLKEESFDLVFTCGVLIHIHPDDLLANMNKIYLLSSKYILVAEYFNQIPVMIEYHGKKDRLFKRDFGKLFIENYDVTLIDYGFLWSHEYDSAGFDDLTYWLFAKK